MIYCPKCGTANNDNSASCVGCGVLFSYEPQPSQTSTVANTLQQNTNFEVPNAKQPKNTKPDDGRFVTPDEAVVATLSNGMLDNVITGEGFKHEDAVVTNKRVYYNHKHGIINVVRMEEKIDLADVTGIKILSVNCAMMLVLAALLAVIAIAVLAMGGEFEIFGSLFVAAIVAVAFYFITLKKHLKIEYAGGSIAFSVRGYKMSNIRQFQKAIYLAKENLK